MGCTDSKPIIDDISSDFYQLKISTFLVDIDSTFMKDINIEKILTYFFGDKNKSGIDILCIQGINNNNVYKDIIKEFKRYVKEYNKEHKYNEHIVLYYYPYDSKRKDGESTSSGDQSDGTWSLTDKSTEDQGSYNKLIISRYEILFFIEEKYYKKTHSKLHSIHNATPNIQSITVDFNNILLNIYNINFLEGKTLLGNNSNTIQLKYLFDLMKVHKKQATEFIKIKNLREKDKLIDRGINIICGNFNINEIRNNVVNKEYVKMIRRMNAIDVFRYVTGIRNKNDFVNNVYNTNVIFSRNSYLLLSVDENTKLDDVNALSKIMYNKYGIIVINSIIDEYMKYNFINYPTEATILFKRDWKGDKTKPDSDDISYKHIQSLINNRNKSDENINDNIKEIIKTLMKNNKDDSSDNSHDVSINHRDRKDKRGNYKKVKKNRDIFIKNINIDINDSASDSRSKSKRNDNVSASDSSSDNDKKNIINIANMLKDKEIKKRMTNGSNHSHPSHSTHPSHSNHQSYLPSKQKSSEDIKPIDCDNKSCDYKVISELTYDKVKHMDRSSYTNKTHKHKHKRKHKHKSRQYSDKSHEVK
jgi:hypothetical protein